MPKHKIAKKRSTNRFFRRNFHGQILHDLLLSLSKREHTCYSYYAARSQTAKRRHDENERKDVRSPYWRDADRILHSMTYCRYIDKTQVFFLVDNDHITHRMLHVQLVSKIARVIGRFLRLNEDLIEAIALGHDIGHPPFGHKGEKFISDIGKKYRLKPYRHSVGSVRHLACIEKTPQGKRLNLTLQVLDGILCHDGERHKQWITPNREKDWSTHDMEIEKKEKFNKDIRPMTLEACVMRFADVISYLGRDIEDAITMKILKRWKDISVPQRCKKFIGGNCRNLIQNMVVDLVENSWERDQIGYSEEMSDAVAELKKFNLTVIYGDRRLTKEAEKVRKMYHYLFDKFVEDLRSGNKRSRIFKDYRRYAQPGYWERASNEEKVRDYIVGMTDDYFWNSFDREYFPKRFGEDITDIQTEGR